MQKFWLKKSWSRQKSAWKSIILTAAKRTLNTYLSAFPWKLQKFSVTKHFKWMRVNMLCCQFVFILNSRESIKYVETG